MNKSPRIKPKHLLLAISLLIVGLIRMQPTWADELPRPQPPSNPVDCYGANIFYGAVPPGSEYAPVVVFVHGYGGLAEDWWSINIVYGINDMYKRAHDAGYRTAFVNLNVDPDTPDCTVERKPAEGQFYNGEVLSKQLDAITEHYNVDQVDIVAHSKGGVDAQTAIIWYGAHKKVANVFNLSVPHQGSLLADLLWGPGGAWLAVLIQRDNASYNLQTSVMESFRAAADASTVDDQIHYYVGAGTGWRGAGGMMEVAGELLQDWDHELGGDNDGIVSVSSTALPGSTILFVEDWDHNEMYMGWNVFPYIHQVLLREHPSRKIFLPLVAHSGALMSGSSK